MALGNLIFERKLSYLFLWKLHPIRHMAFFHHILSLSFPIFPLMPFLFFLIPSVSPLLILTFLFKSFHQSMTSTSLSLRLLLLSFSVITLYKFPDLLNVNSEFLSDQLLLFLVYHILQVIHLHKDFHLVYL